MIKVILIKALRYLIRMAYIVFLVVLYNLLVYTVIFLDLCTELVQKLCINCGIFTEQADDRQTFERKYTDAELLQLAKSLPKNITTIKEIEQEQNISYRQARKVKSIVDNLKNSPNIRQMCA